MREDDWGHNSTKSMEKEALIEHFRYIWFEALIDHFKYHFPATSRTTWALERFGKILIATAFAWEYLELGQFLDFIVSL